MRIILAYKNACTKKPIFPQLKDKASDSIYSKQSILLGPTPCLFTIPNGNQGKTIKLVELNFLAEDSKHSSNRVLQIIEEALKYMICFMRENYG